MAEPVLSLRGFGMTLRGRDGSVTEVSSDLTFDVAPGEFVSIVGPSGSGKTTLLRAASGLRTPTAGEILFSGQPLRGVVPGISVVFQEYNKSLFPWLSIGKNVAMGARRLPPPERDARSGKLCTKSASTASPPATHGSCRAGCSSAPPWPGRLSPTPSC